MTLSSRFYLFVITTLISFTISSCATEQSHTIANLLPAVSHTEITFDEKQIPEQCNVFAHLIISVPAGLSEADVKADVSQYAMDNGADYVLVGMTRESANDPETVIFRFYGPAQPYSFKKHWTGWKFGFKDWNSGGPLVDYGHDRMNGTKPAFDIPVDALAVLLTCQVGPKIQ